MKKITILTLFILFAFSSCQSTKGWFKRSDIKDNPVNVNDRVSKNVEEGRGIRFGKRSKTGGTFDFASSNELWRASIETLDFVPFSNASYSGGILITDWFDGNSKDKNEKRDLKITVRFLSNEIRADALEISIHEKKCKNSFNDCNIIKIQSNLVGEVKLAILKRAAALQRDTLDKNVEEFKKKRGGPVFKKGGK